MMDELFLDTSTAFRAGYIYGRQHGYASPRRANELHPRWSAALIDVFLNGVDDGVRNDPWRFNGGRNG